MAKTPRTKNGYKMSDISSMLQKAIRRNDVPNAAYATRELYFGFRPMIWNRLLTISAEDCFGIVTREIVALNQADSILNGKDSGEESCLTFIAKAITFLCAARKNRDAIYVASNYLWLNQKLSEDELLTFTGHSKTFGPADTKNGYTADDMLTMLHSSTCQSDIPHAAYAVQELYSRFKKQMWNLLLATSDEDCHGVMTEEVMALRSTDNKVNGKKSATHANLMFVAKAIILLSMARKNPNANYISCNSLCMDSAMSNVEFLASIDSSSVENLMRSDFRFQIPDYVFDVYTYRGKKNGKTRLDFLIDENKALNPHQPGLFDNGNYREYYDRCRRIKYPIKPESDLRWQQFMERGEADPTHNGKDFPEFH